MSFEVDDDPPLAEVAQLFREYAASLEFALDFQDFDTEVAALPGAYARPGGVLLVARSGDRPAGCIGLRPLEGVIGEVKRLYVRDAFRGRGAGRLLVDCLLTEARRAGYRRLRLDTVPAMAGAQSLYRSFGFGEIEPYRHNPVPGALFFELEL